MEITLKEVRKSMKIAKSKGMIYIFERCCKEYNLINEEKESAKHSNYASMKIRFVFNEVK